MIDKITVEKFKIDLEKEKNNLEATLSRFAKKDPKLKGDWDTNYPQLGEEFGIYKDEIQDEVEEYDNLIGEEHVLELRLKDVNEALSKIKSGKYGFCEEGKAHLIEIERLNANPAARTCIKHAKQK